MKPHKKFYEKLFEKAKKNDFYKHSLKNVASVKVVRHGKVRRAKLYYLRERTGKAAKVKELVK